ncbi:MAG: 3'-5' exonuclease, partial [Deltaproteobacteria bacterium]|nr:3'-5' exonuclease [Deltaproteobacteria bacterium]
MPPLRRLPLFLLLGSLWLPAPLVAQTLTLAARGIPERHLGLQLGPGRVTVASVKVQGVSGGNLVKVDCNIDHAEVYEAYPTTLELDDSLEGLVYATLRPSPGTWDTSLVPVLHCLVRDVPTSETTLTFEINTEEFSGTYPALELYDHQAMLEGRWWPVTLRYPEDAPTRDLWVEWHALTSNVGLFNEGATDLDPTLATTNFLWVGPPHSGEAVILARVMGGRPEGDFDLLLGVDTAIEAPDREPFFQLDPRFEIHSDTEGVDLPLKLRPDDRGTLRVRARDQDDWGPVEIGRAHWSANWDHARFEPFSPDDVRRGVIESELVTPSPSFSQPRNGGPPRLMVWAMDRDSSAYNYREILVEFTEEVPSIYACGQGPGSEGALPGFLLLLALLVPHFRRPPRRGRGGLLLLLLLLAPAGARAQEEEKKPGLAFTGVVAPSNADPAEVKAISEYLQTELIARGHYQVVGPAEIQALMGLEAQKQLLGCTDTAASCLAEVGGALGSDRLLSGSVTRVGSSVILSLSLLDVQSARLIHRAGERVKIDESLEPLLDVVPRLIDEVIARDELVAGAPHPQTAVGRFHGFARDAVLVAHNAPFDMAFLGRHRAFENPVLDTVLLSAAIFGETEVHT